MTLEVNLVRTVPSVKFTCCYWRNPWRDFHVTHTHQSVMSLPKYEQIINCGFTVLLSLCFPVPLTNNDKAQVWHYW